MCNVQLPDAASKERTEAVMKQLVDIAVKTPGVWHATGVTGQSFVLNAFGSNFGSMFVILNEYSERRDDAAIGGRHRQPLAERVRARCKRRRSPSSGRPRSAAWAVPAGSP